MVAAPYRPTRPTVFWTSPADADAFAAEGVTLFTTEIKPTDDGYNFTELTDMLAWRDSRH